MIRHSSAVRPALLAALVVLAGVVPARAAEPPLTPVRQRNTDEAIAQDLARIDGWSARLERLGAAGKDPWRAAYAQALLQAAREEYADNDTTAFADSALSRAAAVIGDIESGKAPVTTGSAPRSRVLGGSSRVRADLWQDLDSLKTHAGFPCAREEVARCEAALVWAGNEAIDQGECHTSPHLTEAEDWARRARLKAASCIEEAPQARPIQAPVVQVPMPVALPQAEELEIPRNVHFGLNKWDITETSLQVIGGVTAVLQKYPGITVLLEGHTDSRGSVQFNEELSRKRVMKVYEVFVMIGIDSSRIQTSWKGKGDLYATEDSKRGYALNRRVEMVFLDPAGQRIKSTRQETDLQIEEEREAKPAAPRRRRTGAGSP